MCSAFTYFSNPSVPLLHSSSLSSVPHIISLSLFLSLSLSLNISFPLEWFLFSFFFQTLQWVSRDFTWGCGANPSAWSSVCSYFQRHRLSLPCMFPTVPALWHYELFSPKILCPHTNCSLYLESPLFYSLQKFLFTQTLAHRYISVIVFHLPLPSLHLQAKTHITLSLRYYGSALHYHYLYLSLSSPLKFLL